MPPRINLDLLPIYPSTLGAGSGKGHEDKKRLLQVDQQQKEDQENVILLLNGAESTITKDMEKVKVFNYFFTMVFIVNTGLHQSLVPEVFGKVWSWEDLPFQQTGCRQFYGI